MSIARGLFEVKLVPAVIAGPAPGNASIVRTSIDKIFLGELDAASQGEMISAGTEVQGSAGYVALERVVGTLAGRTGSFVLQHSGILNRGTPDLQITVVPDSGTGELIGLSGEMTIDLAGGKHSYEFHFTLKMIEFG